ncbi:MAG: hypothetical protein ABIK62_03675 [candidate division WOR-3 bacterium]
MCRASLFSVLFFLVAITTAGASQKHLWPEAGGTIQALINQDRVQPGDTISVWGDTLQPPPYVYLQNIEDWKGLVIINRSFEPENPTGYEPSCTLVVLRSSQLDQRSEVSRFGGIARIAAAEEGSTVRMPWHISRTTA